MNHSTGSHVSAVVSKSRCRIFPGLCPFELTIESLNYDSAQGLPTNAESFECRQRGPIGGPPLESIACVYRVSPEIVRTIKGVPVLPSTNSRQSGDFALPSLSSSNFRSPHFTLLSPTP
jgi:hypothetical protein